MRVITKSRLFVFGSLFTSIALATFSACSGDDTTGASGSDGSTTDGSSSDALFDVSTPADASRVDGATDSATDAAATICETASCGSTNCGTCPDAAAVAFHDSFQDKTFAVDGFEITNADYAEFVSLNVDPKTQPGFCNFNTSFVPSAQWPAAAGNEKKPVEYVDWCDAYAYCAWAGRALCGNIGGGDNDPVYFDNGDQSAWFFGCTDQKLGTSSSGYQSFPYSDTYDPTICNGHDRSDGGTVVTGSLASCEGGAPGLYDMSGNVTEWEDSCSDDDALDAGIDASATARCNVRGGSFASDAGDLMCGTNVMLPRATNAAGVGFRCCSR